VFTAEPHPVVTPQPSRHARDSGRSSSILTTEASDSVPYCEKLPTDVLAPRPSPERAVGLGPEQDQRAEIAQVLVPGRTPPAGPARRQK
jgi:hypothetical protein